MKKRYQYLSIFILMMAVLTGCEEPVEPSTIKFATFEKETANVGVADGGQSTATFYFLTTNKTSSDRTFNLEVDQDNTTADSQFYTVPMTVTVPGGSNRGMVNIEVNDGSWLDTDQSLSIKLTSDSDNQFTGQNLDLVLYRLCPGTDETKVSFNITFDAYPEEVAWRILDSMGATVAASADPFAYGAYAGMSGSLQVGFCLAAGDYTFEIYDSFQDGAGAYSLSTYDGVTLLGSDGAYGAGESLNFTIN